MTLQHSHWIPTKIHLLYSYKVFDSIVTNYSAWALVVNAMKCKIHYSLLACLADLITQCPEQDLKKPLQVWKPIKWQDLLGGKNGCSTFRTGAKIHFRKKNLGVRGTLIIALVTIQM